MLQGGFTDCVLFAFRLKLYHGTPRALLHPRFQEPMESKRQQDVVPCALVASLTHMSVGILCGPYVVLSGLALLSDRKSLAGQTQVFLCSQHVHSWIITLAVVP